MHGRSQFVSEETLRKYKYGRSRADNADFPGNPSASEEDKEKQYGFQDHFYKRRKIQIELDKGERFKKFKHRKSRVDSDNVSEFSDDSATSDEEKRFTYDDGMPSGLNDSEVSFYSFSSSNNFIFHTFIYNNIFTKFAKNDRKTGRELATKMSAYPRRPARNLAL